MNFGATERMAVGRTVTAAIIVIVLVVAAVAGIYYYASKGSTTTTTSSSSTSSSGTASAGATSTLTIDDETWPTGDLNQLTATGDIPSPDWLDYTVYQSLVTMNGAELYANGTVALEP